MTNASSHTSTVTANSTVKALGKFHFFFSPVGRLSAGRTSAVAMGPSFARRGALRLSAQQPHGGPTAAQGPQGSGPSALISGPAGADPEVTVSRRGERS